MTCIEDIFLHRQNDISKTPDCSGLEIDIRSHFDDLILNHDRLNRDTRYPLLSDKIQFFEDKKVILNVKESGLEEQLADLMQNHDYYFLDSQIPDILKFSKNFTSLSSRFIIRLSDVEDLNLELLKIVNPTYLWLDFSRFSKFDKLDYLEFIRKAMYRVGSRKVIVVSPELYSLDYAVHIPEIFKMARAFLIKFSVCTKHPEIWRNLDDQPKWIDRQV